MEVRWQVLLDDQTCRFSKEKKISGSCQRGEKFGKPEKLRRVGVLKLRSLSKKNAGERTWMPSSIVELGYKRTSSATNFGQHRTGEGGWEGSDGHRKGRYHKVKVRLKTFIARR